MESFFRSMNVAASGMTAERMRFNVIAQNIANAETTRTEDGGPYVRKYVTFREILDSRFNDDDSNSFSGVQVDSIEEDPAPFRLVYDPTHQDADADGYVRYPNVVALKEMVDMMTAQRAYDANTAVISTARSMFNSALNIGRQ
ncbi:MAG TPA: flagellar basal body rod protein FlgC [Petrotogaceae bacterium]|nr:flagellar basal body rod protein FlgC [Petrotogaceae bacterium]HQF32506.1 flagellar basal body rod protein FlgC [Petrotogaceae bacterium]HQI78274.1 flagellar basal body rod protein FlgC [Petrotogaceae bacterium]